MYSEKERFISMYRQQVVHTIDFVSDVPLERYKEIPIDSDSMFMGTRINRINLGSLVRHLVVAENHWFTTLANVVEGDTVPIPKNASVIEGIKDGKPLSEKLKEISKKGISIVEGLTDKQLNTTFNFVGANYTVIGFLWALFGHHAFHKGQIDLLMRQMDMEPAEYMEHKQPTAVIG